MPIDPAKVNSKTVFYDIGQVENLNPEFVTKSLDKKDVDKKSLEYFKHYDANSDGKLDENELVQVLTDLKEADVNQDKDISNKEMNKLIKKTTGKKATKATRKTFLGFMQNIKDNYINKLSNVSDGKIDNAYQQGTGDCWLLSQANALSTTDWGQEAIKESITDDKENKQYKINFKGVDFETVISYEDVQKAREAKTEKGSVKYSTGDIDMLLIELATEKYLQKEMDEGNLLRKDPNSPLTSGYEAGKTTLQYLLTGKTGHEYFFGTTPIDSEKLKDTSKMKDYQKSNWKNVQDYASYATKENRKEQVTKMLEQIAQNPDKYGATVSIYVKKQKLSHAFIIKEIKTDDSGKITDIGIVNPWNGTSRVSHYSYENFINKDITTMGIISESDTYEEFEDGFIPHPKRVEE